MTKDEFIAYWCENSGITREYFDKWFDAKPCVGCDHERCRGWVVSDNDDGTKE